MNRLMGFVVGGNPLTHRPTLGSKVHFHVVWYEIGFPCEAGERYQAAFRMGGTKAGGEVGEQMMNSGIEEYDVAKRILRLLTHCKVGEVSMNNKLKIKENTESSDKAIMRTKSTALHVISPQVSSMVSSQPSRTNM